MKWVEAGVLVSLAVAFLWIVWQFFWGSWAPDLSAVYFAARSYGLGNFDTIYLSPPLFFGGTASPEWAAMAVDLGHPDEPALPYAYAPLWAALLSGIATRLDPIAFYNGALLLNSVLLAATVILVARMLRLNSKQIKLFGFLCFALILAATPFFTAFWLNQPHILLTFLVLFAFERAERGFPITAGALLGVAAALKVFPALFVIVFLLRRDWTAAGATVFVSLGLLATSIAIAGVELHIAFFKQLELIGSATIVTPLNFSLEAWVIRVGELWVGGTPPDLIDKGFYILARDPGLGLVTRFLLIAAVGWLIWIGLRTSYEGLSAPSMLLYMWAAVTLFSPLAWSHYTIGILVLGLGIVLRTAKPRNIWVVVVAIVLLSHPLQRLITSNTNEPLWLMTCGLLSLLLFKVLAVTTLWPRLRPGDRRVPHS